MKSYRAFGLVILALSSKAMFQVPLRTVLIFAASLLSAQTNNLILRGGHVIDPANRVDGVMDVAVSGNRIVAVAPNLAASPGTQVIDVSKCYVVPGLVDLHMHVFG